MKKETDSKVKTPFLNIKTDLLYSFDAKNILNELVSFSFFFDVILFDFRDSKIVNIVSMKPDIVIPNKAISLESQSNFKSKRFDLVK